MNTLPEPLPLYTSRFRTVYDLEPRLIADRHRLGFVPVRTSVGVPRFIPTARAWPYVGELAPYGLMRIEDMGEFEVRYRQRLERHGVEKIRLRLGDLATAYIGLPLYLLCFEDVHGGQRCHRRIFAEWWEERTGQHIPEATEFPTRPRDEERTA